MESNLVNEAIRRIQKRPKFSVCREVPLLGRCVDLAYLDGVSLITVEFKLRDWRRAIIQARDHRLGADYSYICMPERNVSKHLYQELQKAQVGLMFYRKEGKWPFKIVVQAPKSQEIWPVARARVLEYLITNQVASE